MAAVSGRHSGWRLDPSVPRLDYYFAGTRVGHIVASGFSSAATITAATGLTVTTGNTVNTAGDERITAGNLRLGAVSAFATTEPTSAIVFKVGTAPAGAITTSAGIFTEGTVMRKIIAAGTVSNIET
jgi:hypothetical protein